MVVIKRDGREEKFDKTNIYEAVARAFMEEEGGNLSRKSKEIASDIASKLYDRYRKRDRAMSVEEIQNDVEVMIMKSGKLSVASRYIKYRYEHELMRNNRKTDGSILALVDGVNENLIQENSNKNPTILSTQRDYMAGEISKDISMRRLLPKDIVDAHNKGIIHFHDSDYYAQHMFNCCLVDLEGMLKNGTVISGTLIEKPHSFSTACNIATQIIAQVASNQYGGQSISLSHLAPFVDISRKKIREDVTKEYLREQEIIHGRAATELSDDEMRAINEITEGRVRDEVKRGVQTIQYQVVTLMTTNGQAPFITVFMYLNEVSDEQTKNDLAMIIEEVVRQRIEGVKNEKGIWITPAFPKLIYVLEEDNITEGSKYWYLTKLCAECTVKRMVPDYISEKMMLENKIDKNGEGHCYPCINKTCA